MLFAGATRRPDRACQRPCSGWRVAGVVGRRATLPQQGNRSRGAPAAMSACVQSYRVAVRVISKVDREPSTKPQTKSSVTAVSHFDRDDSGHTQPDAPGRLNASTSPVDTRGGLRRPRRQERRLCNIPSRGRSGASFERSRPARVRAGAGVCQPPTLANRCAGDPGGRTRKWRNASAVAVRHLGGFHRGIPG